MPVDHSILRFPNLVPLHADFRCLQIPSTNGHCGFLDEFVLLVERMLAMSPQFAEPATEQLVPSEFVLLADCSASNSVGHSLGSN